MLRSSQHAEADGARQADIKNNQSEVGTCLGLVWFYWHLHESAKFSLSSSRYYSPQSSSKILRSSSPATSLLGCRVLSLARIRLLSIALRRAGAGWIIHIQSKIS